MAITTIHPGSKTTKAVVILKDCLGPGGTPLLKGAKVRLPEADAFTLISGEQAKPLSDADAAKA